MKRLPIGSDTRLPAGALFQLEQGVSQWLECTSGSVWITRSDAPRDIVLEAGQSIAIVDPRDVIVGSINGPASVFTDAGWDLSVAA